MRMAPNGLVGGSEFQGRPVPNEGLSSTKLVRADSTMSGRRLGMDSTTSSLVESTCEKFLQNRRFYYLIHGWRARNDHFCRP